MKFEDIDFPSVAEIQRFVAKYVADEFKGRWPSDDWADIGEHWEVNVWEEEGKRRITLYHDYMEGGFRKTDTSCGIDIPHFTSANGDSGRRGMNKCWLTRCGGEMVEVDSPIKQVISGGVRASAGAGYFWR